MPSTPPIKRHSTFITYNAYGYSKPPVHEPVLMGFNGVRFDNYTNGYHLGNGYRVYSPLLMRFLCPDRISPFGRGGINAYAYCNGDPINRVDPLGTFGIEILSFLLKIIGTTRLRTHQNARPVRAKVAFAGQQYSDDKLHNTFIKNEAVALRVEQLFHDPSMKNEALHNLKPGDLDSDVPRRELAWSRTRKQLDFISKKAYLEQHDDVMRGVINYHTDARLTLEDVAALGRLELTILKSNRPYTYEDSRKSYLFLDTALEVLIKKAECIRYDLAKIESKRQLW